jgi:hypothetical protein
MALAPLTVIRNGRLVLLKTALLPVPSTHMPLPPAQLAEVVSHVPSVAMFQL